MGAGTEAQLPVLDAIAGRLSRSADGLDAAGAGAPGVPDAGEVSAVMGAVIAHLAESAGTMVVGMKAAGDQVTASRQDYARRDEAAARSLRGH